MKNLKKILIIMLCFVFALSFAGCKDEESSGETTYTFSINKTEVTLEVGETFKIVAAYGKEQITYSVENTEVATVSETGLVSAVKVGTTNVNVVAGDKTMICKVNVVSNGYTVELNASEKNMTPGTVLSFKATSFKNGVEYEGNITWSVTGGTIVPNGRNVTFTATEEGTYTLTATSEKGATASCVIKVGDSVSDF